MTLDDFGYAEHVYEKKIKDDKYTFIEGVRNPKSCTILYEGPNEILLQNLQDAANDGIKAINNLYKDRKYIYGAGNFEV